MREILQRVYYLRGLADGMKINDQKDEGKLLLETIEVLEELALAVENLDYRQDLIVEDLDEIDEDLADLEDFVYELDVESYSDFTDFDEIDFDEIDNDYFDEYDFFDEEDEENEELVVEDDDVNEDKDLK